jgi:hypothetical protein
MYQFVMQACEVKAIFRRSYILMLSPQEPCHMFTKREKDIFPPQFDNKASIESKLLLFVTHKKAKLIPNLKVHYASYLR